MKSKELPTRVVFRKWKDSGEVIALFPDLNYANGAANFGNIMSYMRVGQHGEAHESLLRERKRFVKATPAEYADLLKELTGIGYDLKVRR